MSRSQVVLPLLLLLAWPAGAAPRVAVMPILDKSGSLPAPLLESLTDSLRTLLVQTGRHTVIDKSTQSEALQRLVAEQKTESYRVCYEDACQIPLGKALAADSILRTTVDRVGSRIVFNAELVDLASELIVHGAHATAAPGEDRLLRAIGELADQLAGASRAARLETIAAAPGGPDPAPIEVAPPTTSLAVQGPPANREDSWVSGAVICSLIGISGVIGGISSFVASSDHERAANQATDPDVLRSEAEEARDFRTGGWVALGLGTAVLAVGIWAWIAWATPPDSPSLATGPLPGGGWALSLGGRF